MVNRNIQQEEMSIDIYDKFEFRSIHLEEANQAAKMERICFPPNEACSEQLMLERVAKLPESFLVAVDKDTGKIAGLVNGICTDETAFRDEFFKDTSLHNPKGKNTMLVGLEVLPEYRGLGLARALMNQYIQKERANKREVVFLTCLPDKIKMYEKMGFCDDGIANSNWGGEEWHQMRYMICL